MGATATFRLPAGPLLDRIDQSRRHRRADTAHTASVSALARTFGVSGSHAREWLDEGLSPLQADRCAGRLGVHPVDVWGWAWAPDIEFCEWCDEPVVDPVHVIRRSGEGVVCEGDCLESAREDGWRLA